MRTAFSHTRVHTYIHMYIEHRNRCIRCFAKFLFLPDHWTLFAELYISNEWNFCGCVWNKRASDAWSWNFRTVEHARQWKRISMINVLTIRKHQTIQSIESLVFKFRATRTAKARFPASLPRAKAYYYRGCVASPMELFRNKYTRETRVLRRECLGDSRCCCYYIKRATWYGRLKPVVDKPKNRGKRPSSEAPIPATRPRFPPVYVWSQ